MKSREILKIRDFQHFTGFTTVENGFMRSSRYFLYFYFYFYFRKVDLFMLLSDLLQVLNASNFVGIHELAADGNSYDMIYTGQILFTIVLCIMETLRKD